MNGLKICECPNPTIKHFEYHFIGNNIPRLMVGTSFTCKCGGYINNKDFAISQDIKKTVAKFWDNFNPEDF